MNIIYQCSPIYMYDAMLSLTAIAFCTLIIVVNLTDWTSLSMNVRLPVPVGPTCKLLLYVMYQ